MKNIQFEIQKDKLTIEVDLTKDFGPSVSGKTIIVASTEGFVGLDIDKPISFAVNVVMKKN